MFRRYATLRDMSTNEILTLLEAERDRLTKAIEVLKGTNGSGTKASHTPKVTQSWSAAKRKAASARMKAYWQAKRRKRTAGSTGRA
jgi:hypothetical protein